MPHEQSYFEGGASRLFENIWQPETASEAVVVLVHGFTEHGGRYAHVAEALNRRRLAVYAVDLPGHGRSDGDRIWIDAFDEYLDDVEFYLNRVRSREPGKPMFVLGHSMGGTIAALLVIERGLDARGLVLSAPAVKLGATVFPILRRLASLVARFFPRLRLVHLGAGKLSRDPENVARFRADPLVFHGSIPVRTGVEILEAIERIRRRAASARLPLLVLQGTGDAIIDPGGAADFCAQAGSTDKTLKLYDGLYHDLFGEPERERVLADLVEWISSRVGRANHDAGEDAGGSS
jgi:acylglycerol lipase